MMKRHNARIIGVMTIFNLDMNNELNIDEVSDQVAVKELFFTKMDEIKDLVLDDEYSVEIDQSFLNDLLNFVVENYLHIYKIISSSLQNWTIERISYVDRAIMICACAEMMMG
ncbi:MAG: transcription antitermination factor NusB, partial [Bacilli bacterium]